jgi:hypothetical protein
VYASHAVHQHITPSRKHLVHGIDQTAPLFCIIKAVTVEEKLSHALRDTRPLLGLSKD